MLLRGELDEILANHGRNMLLHKLAELEKEKAQAMEELQEIQGSKSEQRRVMGMEQEEVDKQSAKLARTVKLLVRVRKQVISEKRKLKKHVEEIRNLLAKYRLGDIPMGEGSHAEESAHAEGDPRDGRT